MKYLHIETGTHIETFLKSNIIAGKLTLRSPLRSKDNTGLRKKLHRK